MKFGHLLFPVLFFIVLITGAVWIMRSVEQATLVGSSQTVYLEADNQGLEISAESVESTREKAHQAFSRFAETLVENFSLTTEEYDHLNHILQLGEAHWSEENWAPAFYAFERVIRDLSPLIDDGLGQVKANEMEARYAELSRSLSNEIVLVESTYLQGIEKANEGYNALIGKDWVGAIQAFAVALDTLNLVKAQSAEILDSKIQAAYSAFERGALEEASDLFDEVLSIHPTKEEALTGLQLIEVEREGLETALTEDIVLTTADADEPIPAFEDLEAELEWSEDERIVEADRLYERRELKESLRLYLEIRGQTPDIPGLDERINRARDALWDEELIRLLDKAEILRDLEQWTAAIKTYRHILNVDPVHREAREGWEQSLIHWVAHKQVEQYQKLMKHHLDALRFTHANDVLLEARRVLRDRDSFEELFITLTSELDKQLTPIEVVIESDGKTWVCVPGKLAPEQFKKKTITTFPGQLELIGWRKGYERVHLKLGFKAEEAPESISVVCEVRADRVTYTKQSGEKRVTGALEAHGMDGLLEDPQGFSNWLLAEPRTNSSLNSSGQITNWDGLFYRKLYGALTQQADRAYDFTHVDARSQFIQVPEVLSRKEIIELGQYLASQN